MRSITRLFGAFGTLADSLLSLSGVIDAATAKLRLQLATETDPAALAHAGEVLDHAEPEPLAGNATANGRKRKAASPS